MKRTELFFSLSTLSKTEIEKFRKFLLSPYFCNRKVLLKLFDYIIQFYPLFTDSALERDVVHKKLYPRRKFVDATIRNLFSDLHNLLMNFFRIENFSKSATRQHEFLMNELSARGLNAELRKEIELSGRVQDQGVDWQYFLDSHFLEIDRFNYAYLNEKLRKQSRIEEESAYINKAINSLVYFFLTSLISLHKTATSYASSYNSEAGVNIGDAIKLLDFTAIRNLLSTDKDFFVVELYESMLELISDNQENGAYERYREILRANIEKLSRDERTIHMFSLVGYCMTKIFMNPDDDTYNRELLELYKEILAEKYYINKKTQYLSHDEFRNILAHALDIKEYSWTAEFIKEYSHALKPDDSENMKNYGYAYLYYYLGEFGKSLDYINKIETDYFLYKIDIKNLSLKIFYETGYDEEALSLIKTYKQSISANKMINPERRRRYVNFSKCTEQLIRYRTGSSRQDIGYIKHKLTGNSEVAFKGWLFERIEQIEKKYVRAV